MTELTNICPVSWVDGAVKMLDQRLLPEQEAYLRLQTAREVAAAISNMAVRGAPAIGIAAAYGAVLAARESVTEDNRNWRTEFASRLVVLEQARPTAVNLGWAIARMRRLAADLDDDPEAALLEEARAIHEEDIEANHRIGELGAAIIGGVDTVLTHCNAGALATGGYGTALGVVRSLFAKKQLVMVYACETRPWLQGARLTTWELIKDHIPVTLITDSTASALMQSGRIGCVIVGADRIAANGDVANKIGTYNHAVSARHHGVRFMVAAPTSTIDLDTVSGKEIPVEERNIRELTHFSGRRIVPEMSEIYNPVFDITPADLIDYIVTENGAAEQPDRTKIRDLMHISTHF